jgi:hypothetical protein
MGFFDNLFGKRASNEDVDLSALHLSPHEEGHVRTFRTKSAQERMGVIMALGDKGNPGHWGLMRYALLLDPDKDVTFAALKRIGNFPDKEGAAKLLHKLDQRGSGESLEPYLSMAKVRLGLMTNEEFENRMNRGPK